MEKFVKIGIVPIKRGFTDMVSALEQKNLFLNKCRQIAPDAVALCDLEGVLPEGILYDADQLDAVREYLLEQKADALFMPHCDFGNEEVVGRLGAMMKLPVLVWGNRDPLPVPGMRDRDTQCGTLASTKCLQRYRVPFSYIINSDVDGEMFQKGFIDFCSVAAVVKKARGMRILARNWRSGPLELDLVCREGDTLVFVEVKTRGPGSLGSALDAVGPRKRQTLIRAARAWLAAHDQWHLPCRFDLVCIEPGPTGPHMEHIRHAFDLSGSGPSVDSGHASWQPW